MTRRQLEEVRPLLAAWTAANRAARRAYEADQGLAHDYTAAGHHAAANRRYRDRIKKERP